MKRVKIGKKDNVELYIENGKSHMRGIGCGVTAKIIPTKDGKITGRGIDCGFQCTCETLSELVIKFAIYALECYMHAIRCDRETTSKFLEYADERGCSSAYCALNAYLYSY